MFQLPGEVVMYRTLCAVASILAIVCLVADGDGSITDGVRTLVAGGAAIRQTFTCSYTVNPDGTGSARCTVITEGFPNSVETFDFVIVERKKEAFFTSTTAGSTIRGRTK